MNVQLHAVNNASLRQTSDTPNQVPNNRHPDVSDVGSPTADATERTTTLGSAVPVSGGAEKSALLAPRFDKDPIA
ncbi:MAG TPA: hypothetical protein VFH51_20995, partial [Myxococcota bacterium]|nr:hypothetical protein [Myxococcota bacterium]